MDAGSRVRLACVADATVSGVLLSAQAPAPTAPALEFEVASVKPQPTVPPNPPVRQPPDRFHRPAITLANLINYAWDMRPFRIVGGPDWGPDCAMGSHGQSRP